MYTLLFLITRGVGSQGTMGVMVVIANNFKVRGPDSNSRAQEYGYN